MRFLLLLICLLYTTNLFAADGCTVKGSIKNNVGAKLYLCHYYGKVSDVYKDDSCDLTLGTTNFSITKAKKIVGGTYLLVLDDRSTQLEVLINNGDIIELSYDQKDPKETVKFKNSEANTRYYLYQKQLSLVSKEIEKNKEDLKKATNKKDSTFIESNVTKTFDRLDSIRSNYISKYPNDFLSTIFNTIWEPNMEEVKIPVFENGRKDSNFTVQYIKDNFWRKFNFKDDRIVYTPLFNRKISNYFQLVGPVPDSVIAASDKILTAMDGTKDLTHYSLWWITRFAETSKVMGMDEVFVHLVENYYMKGKAYWLDEATIKKYVKRAQEIAPNVIGKTATELTMLDNTNKQVSLNNCIAKSDYTILAFYSPTCGHCKKEIPAIDSVVKVLNKQLKINIFGVCADHDYEEWQKFIIKNQLNTSWIHAKDPEDKSNFRSIYDVWSTPIVYVLDKNGIIVGKKIDHKNIITLINNLQKKK